MFGFINRMRGLETRSAEIDVGALYQSFFQFGSSGGYNRGSNHPRFWFPP